MSIARFAELVDLTQIQYLADANYKANRMPMGIIDAVDNTILAGAGRQEICKHFHRNHPVSRAACLEGDGDLQRCLAEGQPYAARCKNGLWDIDIPILVNGHHVASVMLGQFLYDNEVPDREFFIRQAEQTGCDIPACLQAMEQVPRFSREQVARLLEYNTVFARIIADLATKNWKLQRELNDRQRIEDVLRESERKLSLTLQSIGDGLIATDARGCVTMMNAMAERLTGWKMAEAAGLPVATVFRIATTYSRSPLENPVDKVIRDGHTIAGETNAILIGRNGNEWLIASSVAPIRLVEGGPLQGVVLIFRDQTQECKTQDELARSEHRLRTLIDIAPFGAFEYELKPDGRLIFIGSNRAADRIIGVPCAQFVGKTLEESFPALAATKIPALFRAVAGGGAPVEEETVEYQHTQIQGFFEFSAIQTAQGRIAVFFRDVTGRKRAEAALIKRLEVLTGPLDDTSDLRFEDLFDLQEVQKIQDAFAATTGLASLITDPTGKPLTRPSGFCHLCEGIIRKTEKGRVNCRCSDVALGQMNPDGPLFQPCLSGGLWDGGTSICVGNRHIASWFVGQVLDENADMDAMLRYAREIGADEDAYREALARVPRMSRDQFAKACQALFLIAKQLSLLALQNVQQAREITRRLTAEDQRRKLELQIQNARKLESLGVLAGGIAHDFNNLLMAILGHADLALQDLSPVSPVRENLREIETASRRAAGLCQQMLAYSGKGKFVIQVVNLAEVVEEMTNMLEVSISKKAVLRFNFAPDLPPVEVDVTQLRQVVMNLIVNASEAIGNKSGVIAVTTGAMECDPAYLSETWLDEKQQPGLYVYLEVADTGSGMDRETLAKIFDPFFTTKFTGRGLGLAAVLGIVRGHKGAIKVYSEPGRGTTFKILFPASRRPAQRLKSAGEPAQTWKSRGTILLVDDEETIRVLCKKMLERFGFNVMTAADGCEALKVFQDSPDEIRLVLLDLTMPHMDGEETFRELRRLRADVCVIVASGYNEMEVSQRFVGKGLAGFIQKPYQMSALERVLRSALRELE